ncbi:MAG TPA: bifunctional phosphoribosylaminoimidazolecarboxamide formyltransferase/IMP cyclohydrolase [Solirubrobacterales bacterium]|nr:bifunctional phosphoribosylaminoimidazolecarboxamide formyltransferase/IMP cyclohydrolase [Solirubrobacterales bacterium]
MPGEAQEQETAKTNGKTVEITSPGAVRIRRALLSVSDKRGLVDFARGLAELGIEIVSTGGTAKELSDNGVKVVPIETYTGSPEILDGRVKTLHPTVHAGLLAVRDSEDHVSQLNEHGIEPIDLVCVNLYPFQRYANRRGVSDAEVLEQIDVGGPTMVRAAAKNYRFTGIVVSPESYDAVIEELNEDDCTLGLETRESLATDAFNYTAQYEAAISQWFNERTGNVPDQFVRVYEKAIDLPYGENPHQRAAYYAEVGSRTDLLSMVGQEQGKDLSYNNLLDLDSGRLLIEEFELPCCAILKHNNPCGIAISTNLSDAYDKALATDPLSAFGGIYIFNREVDGELAKKLVEHFVEMVFAPSYSEDAFRILSEKENLRVLENGERRKWPVSDPDIRGVRGGMLLQDRDVDIETRDAMNIVTQAHPSEKQWGDLLFAWRVCKHVRSNAIVLARDLATLGVGAGQMSRVDSVKLAVKKSRSSLEGAVMASDAFFPFADGVEYALKEGVTAIIQPGGSKRDPEVVKACDDAGIAMVFTGRRHFRH